MFTVPSDSEKYSPLSSQPILTSDSNKSPALLSSALGVGALLVDWLSGDSKLVSSVVGDNMSIVSVGNGSVAAARGTSAISRVSTSAYICLIITTSCSDTNSVQSSCSPKNERWLVKQVLAGNLCSVGGAHAEYRAVNASRSG